MSKTRILIPLENIDDNNCPDDDTNQAKNNYKTVFNFLNDKNIDVELSYEDFLTAINMNEKHQASKNPAFF